MLLAAQLFTEELNTQKIEYYVHDTENSTVITFPFDKMHTNFIFSGDDGRYVSMYTLMCAVPKDKTHDVILLCNTLNAETKWFKFYIDDENDLMMQDNAILSPESAAGECFELLDRRMTVLEKMKPTVQRAIAP